MTRKQAEKIADRIVAAARKSGTPAATWTTTDIQLPDSDIEALDNNLALIVGVMPMGWRLTGKRGLSTVTVVRAL